MSFRHLITRISVLALLSAGLLLCSTVQAQSLDACELDLDRAQDAEGCGQDHIRSAGWMRLGFAPDAAGLLTAGNLSGQIQLTPASASEVRIAQIQPTQPTVWLSLLDVRATLVPETWIDVVLVRGQSADSYSLAIVRWVAQGLSVTPTVLGTSSSFTQSGALELSVGWSYSAGEVTVNVTGPGSTSLGVQQANFGSSLPWLSLPHFPSGNAELSAVSLQGLTGATP